MSGHHFPSVREGRLELTELPWRGKCFDRNCLLPRLDLSKNFLTAVAAGHLAQALLDNATLAVLRLEGNSLRAEGVERLGHLKGVNRSVWKVGGERFWSVSGGVLCS